MPVQKPWLIVFDLDGTLIDSSLDLCLAVNAALEHVSEQPLPHALIAGYIGDGAAMLVRRALGQPEHLDSAPLPEGYDRTKFEHAFAFFLEYYREHKLDNTRLYTGVLPALAQIRARSPQTLMAVLTNKPVRPSREICEALGIASYLLANYGGDSFATKKPDPAGLESLVVQARELRHAQEPGLDLPTGNVVMVGDSAVDVLTARRAGTRSLGCRYGLAPADLERASPDVLCDSPAAWPSLFGFSE